MISASCALAEEAWYISYGDYGEPIGDLQYLLGVEEKYYGEYYFGDETLRALKAFQRDVGITRTGVFDDLTLEYLLDVYPRDEVDTWLVWVPMFGGYCYHDRETCGNMLEPRQMELVCAEALGFVACMRRGCYG